MGAAAVDFNHDGSQLLIAFGITIEVRDVASGEVLESYRCDDNVTEALFLQNPSRIAYTTENKDDPETSWVTGNLFVQQRNSPLRLEKISAHDKIIFSLAANHDDTLLLTGGTDKKAKLWRSKNLELVETYQGFDPCWTVAVSFVPKQDRIIVAPWGARIYSLPNVE